jgi:hypothetical protein
MDSGPVDPVILQRIEIPAIKFEPGIATPPQDSRTILNLSVNNDRIVTPRGGREGVGVRDGPLLGTQ